MSFPSHVWTYAPVSEVEYTTSDLAGTVVERFRYKGMAPAPSGGMDGLIAALLSQPARGHWVAKFLLAHPDELSQFVDPQHREKTFDKNQPRDDHGRWVEKSHILAAAKDPKKAAELKSQVTDPEQRKKLDKAISHARRNPQDFGGRHSTLGDLGTRAVKGRQSVEETAEHVHRLRAEVGDGPVTHEHVYVLAQLIAEHSVAEVRKLKAHLGVQASRDAAKEQLVGEVAHRALKWAKEKMDGVKAQRAKRERTAELKKAGHTGEDEYGRKWQSGNVVPEQPKQPTPPVQSDGKGYSFGDPSEIGGGVRRIAAFDRDGNEIGHVEYAVDDGKITVGDVKVLEKHRRQGVATGLYEKMLAANPDAKLTSKLQSDEGEKFRQAFDAGHADRLHAGGGAGTEWTPTGYDSANKTYFVTDSNGAKQFGKVFRKGSKQHIIEQVASDAARKLGVPTPITVATEKEGRPATISKMVDGKPISKDPEGYTRAVSAMSPRDFDAHALHAFLTADNDRSGKNFMVGSDGRIYAIDHESALYPEGDGNDGIQAGVNALRSNAIVQQGHPRGLADQMARPIDPAQLATAIEAGKAMADEVKGKVSKAAERTLAERLAHLEAVAAKPNPTFGDIFHGAKNNLFTRTGEEEPWPEANHSTRPKAVKGTNSSLVPAEGSAKEVVASDTPPVGVSAQAFSVYQKAVAKKDAGKLTELLAPGNKKLREHFRQATGVELPAGSRATKEAVKAWSLGGKSVVTPAENNPFVESRVRVAAMKLGGGQEGRRVLLKDLRKELPDLPPAELEQAVRGMSRDGHLSLYPLDDPRQIKAEDREAAIHSSTGVPQHLLYLGGIPSNTPEPGGHSVEISPYSQQYHSGEGGLDLGGSDDHEYPSTSRLFAESGDTPYSEPHHGSLFDAGEPVHEHDAHRAINDVLDSAGRRFDGTKTGGRKTFDDALGDLSHLDTHLAKGGHYDDESENGFGDMAKNYRKTLADVEAGKYDSRDHETDKPDELASDAASNVAGGHSPDFGTATADQRLATKYHNRVREALEKDIERRVMERHAEGGPASAHELAKRQEGTTKGGTADMPAGSLPPTDAEPATSPPVENPATPSAPKWSASGGMTAEQGERALREMMDGTRKYEMRTVNQATAAIEEEANGGPNSKEGKAGGNALRAVAARLGVADHDKGEWRKVRTKIREHVLDAVVAKERAARQPGVGDTTPTSPTEGTNSSPLDDKTRFAQAFDELDKKSGNNFVNLADLKEQFPHLSREQFHLLFNDMRRSREFTAKSRERVAPMTDRERAVVMPEEGEDILYASRRLDHPNHPNNRHGLTDEDGQPLQFTRPLSHAVTGELADMRAGGRDTSALENGLYNSSHADENPYTSDRDHRRALGRTLFGAAKDADRVGKADAADAARHVLEKHVGAERIGTAGETVPFDARHHESDVSVGNGQPVKVDRPGHVLKEDGGTEYILGKAKVSSKKDTTPISASGDVAYNQSKSEIGNENGQQQSNRSGRVATAVDGTDRSGSPTGADAGGKPKPAPFRPRVATARSEHTRTGNPGLLSQSVIPHLGHEQQQGAALAVDAMTKHGGFLNADGTGVGKTRQQLAVAKTFADQGKKVLIVSPKQVTKADFKKGTLSGSFDHDAKAMGVPLKLTKGDEHLTPGQVHISTYENLSKLKDKIDKNTVVLFDESHYMKNPTSARAKAGEAMADAAHSVGYFSATPGDKAIHIAHLKRAGVFGTAGKTKTFEKLGMELHDQHVGGGEYRKVWRVKPGVKKEEVARRMSGLFDQMTKDGLMVKRELGMEGVGFNTDHIQLSPDQHAEVKKVYDDVMHQTDGNRAVALMAARMHQEHMKIPHTVEQVKRDLAAGRQPVVFAGRVNAVGDEGEDHHDDEVKDALTKSGHSSPGTIPALRQALIAAGVPEHHLAELHGDAKEKPEKAMDRFQSGKAKVMLATIQSGGTGVNLDDTKGDAPRSVHVMTPPLTANDMAQAIGRVHRLNTKSASNIHAVLSDTDIDKWNAALLHDKFRSLGAIGGGQITRGGELVGAATTHETAEHEPFNWGESLYDTRHYFDTPAYHNELIGRFGGKRVKKGGEFTTEFPSPEHFQKYRQAATERDAAFRAKNEAEAKAAASRQPKHHGGRDHSFTQLKNGNWGARIAGDSNEGDTAVLTTKRGDTKHVKLGRKVWSGNGVTLHEIA